MKIYQNPGAELLVGIIAPCFVLFITIVQLQATWLNNGFDHTFLITLLFLIPLTVMSLMQLISAAARIKNRQTPLFETTSDRFIIFNPVTGSKLELKFDDIQVILFEKGYMKGNGYIRIVLFSGKYFKYNLYKALVKPSILSKELADSIPGFQMAYHWDYRVLHRLDDHPAKYFQEFSNRELKT